MDEQLKNLIEGAKKQGATDNDIKKIIDMYIADQKKKGSSEFISQEKSVESPTRTTQQGTSSDTEPPTRAQVSVGLGGPTKLFGQEQQQRPTSIMYGDGLKKEEFVPPSTPIDAKPKKYYRVVADERKNVQSAITTLEDKNLKLGRSLEEIQNDGTYQYLQKKKQQLDEEFRPAALAIKEVKKEAAFGTGIIERLISSATEGKYSYLSTETIKLDKDVEDKLVDLYDNAPEEIKQKWYKGALPLEKKEELINAAKTDVLNTNYKKLKEENKYFLTNIKDNTTISQEEKIVAYNILKAKNEAFDAKVASEFADDILKDNFKATTKSKDLDEAIMGRFKGFFPEQADVVSTFLEGMGQVVAKVEAGIPEMILMGGERFNQMIGTSDENNYTPIEATLDLINDTTNLNFLPSSKIEKGKIVTEGGDFNINLYSIEKSLANTLPFTLKIMNDVKKGRIEGAPQSMISQLINPKYSKGFADKLRVVETAYKATIGDNYRDAKDMGMDDSKAYTYANVLSLAEGVSENIMPDFKYFDSLTGATLKNAFKGSLKSAATKQAAKNVTKDFFKNVALELGEEEFVLAVEDGLKYSLLLNHKNSEFFNLKRQKELLAATVIMSGGMGIVGAPGKFTENRNDIYREVYNNIDNLQDSFNAEINSPLNDEKTKQTFRDAYKFASDVSNAIAKAPQNVTADQVDLLVQKNKLEEKKKTIDAAFHPDINEEIAGIDTKIRELAKAPAVEEMSVNAPAVEVTEEKIDNRPIAERQAEAESKIKRKDLFTGVGEFSSELGGSDKSAVPVSHKEKNGIEFVEYAHPDTGSVDVIVTGKSDNDFVGFYRIYENGKPTNKWSSKFENQSRNKEDFKTMISGVQEMLPEGHEYTEKTSISTDGLRVWNQQLEKGYEIQTDEKGNIVTNEVAINGDAIVNELGVDVNKGNFENIRITKEQFETVKKALLPYLEKLGLNESNIRFSGENVSIPGVKGSVKIDLPVLRKTKQEAAPAETKTETAPEATVKTIGTNPITSIDVVDDYNDMTKQYRDKKKAITLLARDNEITTKEADSLIKELFKNLNEAKSTPKTTTEVVTEVTPETTAIEEIAPSEIETTLDEVITPASKNIKEQIARAKKAISKFLPNVEIVYHTTAESFQSVVGDNSRGYYDPNTKKIHINGSNATNNTVAHEVFHAVILKYITSDKQATALTNRMFKALIKSLKGNPKLLKDITDFSKRYEKREQSEEKLAEVLGYLASEYETLPDVSKNIIQKWIENIAKMVGIKKFTDQEVVDFMNTIATKVSTGQEITEGDVKNVLGSGTISSSNISGRSSKFIDSLVFNRFPTNKNTKVVENFDLSTIDGQVAASTLSDKLTAGELKKYVTRNGERILEATYTFFGGIGYPEVTGYVWAASNIAGVKKIIDDMKVSSDGYRYLIPAVMSNVSHMSNKNMTSITMEVFKEAINNNELNITKFKEIVSKAFDNKKTSKFKDGAMAAISGNISGDKMTDNLRDYILSSDMTFESRKDLLQSMVGNPASGNPKFSTVGTFLSLAKSLSEPMAKDAELYQVPVIIRTKGNLTPVKTNKTDKFYHESYGYHIESDQEIEVLHLDGVYNLVDIIPEFTKEDGTTVSTEVELKEKGAKGWDIKRILTNLGRTHGLSKYSGKIVSKKRLQKVADISIEAVDFENESENIDVYEASETAEKIAKDNGINILRGKELINVALNKNGDVVGGLWTEISDDEFSFDIAVDKTSQGKGIGEKLVNQAISEFNAQNYEDQLKYKIDVTNPIMEKLLSKYGFEVVDEFPGHTIMEHPTNNPKIEVKGRRQISPENSSNYANMTEDGKGNFVFYHFGPRGIKAIDPKKYGSNKGAITSKPEIAAMGRVGGMSQFYTMPEYQESNVSGDKYMIKVPMDKVYDFNTDPENFYDKAREMFKAKHPDLPFTANDQLAYITKLAEKAGYDMTVAEWNNMSRAQSTKALKPVDTQIMEGNVISKPFKEDYESNSAKGFEPVIPTSKEAKLKDVYKKINAERNAKNRYDSLYSLAEDFPKLSQDKITDMIETSDISQEMKDAYAEALAYEPGPRMSGRKQKSPIDTAVETAKRKGFNDKEIADYLVGKGYTRAQATNAILRYNNVTATKLRKEDSVFTKEGRNKIITFLDQVKRRALSAKSFLPKSVFIMKEGIEANIKAEAKRASYLVDDFNRLVKGYKGDLNALNDEFDKYLRGDQTAVLPDEFKVVAGKMRMHIDNLSQMLLRTGAVSVSQAETIAANLGQYINRSYQVFDKKNWAKQVKEEMKEAARVDLRNMYRASAEAKAKQTGMDADIILEKFINDKIDELISGESAATFLGIGKTGSKDLSIMKQRLDIPLSIRQLMGEYTDASQNYARTVIKIATLAENARFLQSARDAGMGVFFFKEGDLNKPSEFNVQIAGEGSETMNPLNGLFTTKEIADAFKTSVSAEKFIEGFVGPNAASSVVSLYTNYMKLLSVVKWVKTIASVATHFKNVTGNIWFMLSNGYFNYKKYSEAFNVLKNSSNEQLRDKLDEYIRAGIIDQSAALGEIKSMFSDADFDTAIENRLKKNPIEKAKKASRWVVTKLNTAYQLEDDFYKIVSYESEKDRYSNAIFDKPFDQLTTEQQNIIKEKTSEITKNVLANYARIPGLVKLIKIAPVTGTFISFQAEAYRTAWNTVALAFDELSSNNKKIKAIGAKRLAGIAFSQSVKFGLMTAIGTVLRGGDDDDEEDKLNKNVREFVPEWSKKSDLALVEYGNGKFSYVDFSASDPHGGIKKAYNSFMAGDGAVESFTNGMSEILGPFVKKDMLLEAITDINNNENSYGGKLYNDADTNVNKINAVAERFYKVLEPGSLTSARKIAQAENVGNELAGQLTGYKVITIDVGQQLGFKMNKSKDDIREAKRLYNSAFYKFEDGKMTAEELESNYNQANSAQKEMYKSIMDNMKAASFFGVEDMVIDDAMEGIGKGVVNDLWYGDVPDMKQKEKKLTDAEFRAKYGEKVYNQMLRSRELLKKGAK